MKKKLIIVLAMVLIFNFIPIVQFADGYPVDYTVSLTQDISGNQNFDNLTINNEVTLTIKAHVGGGQSRISVGGSIKVNGSLDAEDSNQRLEIKKDCSVIGISLYETDGTTPITSFPNDHVEFEYRNVENVEGKRWVLLQPGPGGGGDLTVDNPKDISGNENYDNIKIVSGGALTIKAAEGGGQSRISVNNSLTVEVNGSLVGDPEQRLEIRQACTVSGVILYKSDGTTAFTLPPDRHVEFEYVEASAKWVEAEAGPGPGGINYSISLNYDNSHGSIKLNGKPENGNPSFPQGDDISIEIEVSHGYKISDVKIDDESKGPIISYSFDNIQTDHTISVTFSPLTYSITASAGEGGSISPSGTTIVNYDSDQSFTITPNDGYRIKGIIVDDRPEGNNSPYRFNHVTDDHTINATFEQIGNGTKHTITVIPTSNGQVKVGEDVLNSPTGGSIQVSDEYDQEFTIIPAEGYYIFSIIAKSENDQEGLDHIYNIEYRDGNFYIKTPEVREDLSLEVTFKENNIADLLAKSFAIVYTEASDEVAIIAALSKEFTSIGFKIGADNISVSGIDKTLIATKGYGTFNFTVTLGTEESSTQTGYIVPNSNDVLFKFNGTNNGTTVNEVRIAREADGQKKIFSAPAITSGYMECFGPGNTHYEGWTSEDTRDAFGDLIGSSKLPIKKAFYRVQLHITGNNLNWFAFDLIQDNAYCLEVAASSVVGGGIVQETCEWDLNRYAEITERSYTSNVFFGNKTFTIAAPESGIGGINSFTIPVGEYPGYKITKDESSGKYSVEFLSDFYNKVTLDIIINGQYTRQLIVNRVGVNIGECDNHGLYQVSHGTQYGNTINYEDGKNYSIYATYYIPNFAVTAPYGLYVTYYWANGSITTKIIKEHLTTGNDYASATVENGIFIYAENPNNDLVNCCDYLLHSSTDKNGAPIKIGVTVLKNEINTTSIFGGVDFGSGSGVEWIRK